MNKHAITAEPISPIPPDDLQRKLAVAQPNEDEKLPHFSLVGDTYTILLSGNVWIVEELRFPAEVFSLRQPVQFWCLPINFRKFSGGFCRPVIVVDE